MLNRSSFRPGGWQDGLRSDKNKRVDLRGGIIKVIVRAENPVVFHVHEDLLCSNSDYFRSAIQKGWKESLDRVVKLEDEEPEVFQTYANWLYFNRLPVGDDRPGFECTGEYLHLAKCYVFGDKRCDFKFKKAAIHAFIQKTMSPASDGLCWYPFGPVIHYIYENTTVGSKARLLLVDLYSDEKMFSLLSEYADVSDLPKEFVLNPKQPHDHRLGPPGGGPSIPGRGARYPQFEYYYDD